MFDAKRLTSRRVLLQGLGVSFILPVALPVLNSALSAAPAAPSATQAPVQGRLDYVCPMDADVRSDKPGFCTRCGMRLRLGIPDLKEYRLELTTSPSIIHPGEKVRLFFSFRDPSTGVPVKDFEIVHEKLFHMFIISTDLQYFLHDHPVLQPDGSFIFDQVFPKAGMYRLVADVFPSSGSPQLIPKTIFVAPAAASPASAAASPASAAASPASNDAPLLEDGKLQPDVGVQHGANTDVTVSMIPAKAIAGAKTLVFFHFDKADGMEKYLGAWAHMLIASDDTIDLIHEHPVTADGGPQMQFTLIFPRARIYRVWIQFQRNGVLNTVAVNIPVVTLEQSEGVG